MTKIRITIPIIKTNQSRRSLFEMIRNHLSFSWTYSTNFLLMVRVATLFIFVPKLKITDLQTLILGRLYNRKINIKRKGVDIGGKVKSIPYNFYKLSIIEHIRPIT